MKGAPLRIAMIGQKGIPATWGGVERHVEELSARLAQRGHKVTVFVRPHYTAASGTYRGVRLVRLPSVPTVHLDAITHAALCTAAALLEPFDVLHYHAVGPTLLAAVPRCLGRRVVATVHGMDWRRAKWGLGARLALRCGAAAAGGVPHRTIVVSRELLGCIGRRGRRPVLIPNGVEAAPFRPLRSLKRFGVEKGKFVLWMGRFVPEKRVEDLIRAFRGMEGDVRLLLAGDVPPRDKYAASVAEAAQGDPRIVLAGGLYGDDKAEALSNAALAVVCSEVEGMPIAALEAMAAGRCVVASDIAPMREIVHRGRTGLLYPTGDEAALRRAMEEALAHPAATAAIGAAAKRAVEGKYDWGAVAERTEEVYWEAVFS